ncbi:AAA family ATPase [Candidatus Thioglobus sp.]|uniref:bifunctional aminoglycoside phosphotransferase/ATP-binding protein n=1 Tax=Candidatus Thioglobus sp. TaxID=2026721 RepID=UPI003242BE5B
MGMMNIEQRLLNPSAYPHHVDKVEHVETHISHIFLAGEYAYKVKKPLNLGFLDFSTLEDRKHFCTEEVRLNSRLAKDIYIDVVSIIRNDDRVFITDKQTDKHTNVVEYAVRMHRFDREMELDKLLENHSKHWKNEWLDELCITVAKFHLDSTRAKANSGYGEVDVIFSFALENFVQIKQHLHNHQHIVKASEQLQEWTTLQKKRLSGEIDSRLKNGFVRECHGDMHLANMVHWKSKVQIFDGIEFSDELRWIDVISEVAFLVMDLESRKRPDLAWQFLNGYLSLTGDYAGLSLLDFYRSYLAIVRAKVLSIRCAQLNVRDTKEQKILLDGVEHYLALASAYTQPRKPIVIMLHGLSGSGKSTLAARLNERLLAIWIRSDVERKRLFGLFDGSQGSLLKGDMYAPKATRATYQRLLDLTKSIIENGYSVIVDATFLQLKERQMFYQAFDKTDVPIIILDLQVEKNELRERVLKRSNDQNNISDADVSVLEQQFHSLEPLKDTEKATILHINANTILDSKVIANKVRKSINTTN